DDSAWKVHAGAALEGVVVQRRPGRDVVTDVGDGDQQPPCRPLALLGADVDGHAEHRIVEIARVLAVDGDEGQVAQVDPALEFARLDGGGQLGRLGHGRLGEIDGNVELAHGDLDLHAGVVDFAQHFDDPP